MWKKYSNTLTKKKSKIPHNKPTLDNLPPKCQPKLQIYHIKQNPRILIWCIIDIYVYVYIMLTNIVIKFIILFQKLLEKHHEQINHENQKLAGTNHL